MTNRFTTFTNNGERIQHAAYWAQSQMSAHLLHPELFTAWLVSQEDELQHIVFMNGYNAAIGLYKNWLRTEGLMK